MIPRWVGTARAASLTLGLISIGLALTPRTASAQASAAQQEVVLARTRELVEVMRLRLGDTHAALRAGALDSLFDFKALVAAPIAAQSGVFTTTQRGKIEGIFAKLVRQLAYTSGAQFAHGTCKISDKVRQLTSNQLVSDVTVSQPDDDVDNEVSFVWCQRPQGWRVIDIYLDGASVEKDYENQFAKIIKRDGADGLIKKMQSRLLEAQQASSATKP